MFRDILDPIERRTVLDRDEPYQLLVAKRSRGGIAPREILKGREILTPTQFRVREGDFVISRRQIVHGACGIVPAELDGAIVSNEYAAFRSKPNLLLAFFNYFTHTPYFQQACFQSSIGIDVEKMVLKLDNWLNTPMYLPPLEEQDTIATLLNSSASLTDVLYRLSLALTARKDAVLEEVLRNIVSGSRYGSTTLGAVTNIVTERATEADQSFCVDLENIAADEGRLVQLGENRAPSGNRVVFREGDVLYGKLRPYLRKYWLANRAGSCSGEIWVLRSNPVELAPSLLFYIVQSTAFERATKVVSGSKMPRADWRLVSQLPIVLPELRRQEEVAGYLAACDSEIDLVRRRLDLQRELHGQLVVELTSGGLRHRRYARG